MSVTPSEAPEFPLPRTCPLDPPELYKSVRASGGRHLVKMWDGKPSWIFTRYDDVRAILGDNRFTTVPGTPGYPMLSAAREAVLQLPPAFIRMDPPDHTRLRRMFTREFMVKRIEAMRPKIARLIDDLYDKLAAKGQTVDLLSEFTLPMTSTVIAELLGIPPADREFFQEQSQRKLMLDVSPDVPREASAKLLGYCEAVIREKERDPEAHDDLLGRLIIEQIRPGHMTREEAVIHADLLTLAGHETTANQIALGTLNFLQNPDQKQKLVDDPSLLKGAIEEILRYNSIVQFNGARVALEDVDVNGQIVRKGEAVFALILAANRDPEIFDDPDRFDITRKADNHVAFSYGVHQCLGQPLARLEMELVFSTIFTRFPDLRLAVPAEQIRFNEHHMVYGVKELPVDL